MSNHYAAALTYEPSNFKLDHNPVICAFEPPEDPNISNVSEKMLSLTGYVFDDWKSKITNGERNSAWDITLIKVMQSQQKTFNASQCNIRVNYFPSPSVRINSLEPTGITQYQTNHTADVEIYYNNYGDGYYTNALGTDEQLSKTLEHELGHAFGLSHVILSDQELQNINTGAEDMPSIMVPYALSTGIHYYSITPSDISQLKSIYNNQGFGVYAQTNLSTQSATTHQISITTSKQVYHDGDHIVIIIHVSHVTGSNGILTFTLPADSSQIKSITNQVVVSELQTSITYPNAVNETNSVKGTYKVNFSYDNKTDSTSFQIIGQLPSIAYTPTIQNPDEQVTNDPKYDVFRNPLLFDIQNGHISDFNFGNSFFALEQDGLIHVNITEKSNGSVIKPHWFDSVIILWAERKISDKDYASCIQFLHDSKLLQM